MAELNDVPPCSRSMATSRWIANTAGGWPRSSYRDSDRSCVTGALTFWAWSGASDGV